MSNCQGKRIAHVLISQRRSPQKSPTGSEEKIKKGSVKKTERNGGGKRR